jgi:hypothetical protein
MRGEKEKKIVLLLDESFISYKKLNKENERKHSLFYNPCIKIG